MKHTFISLGFYCILFVCSGCTREIEINDERETEQARIPLVVQTTTCDFNNVSANGKPSTRIPMENGFETLFNTGDAIGIFAIKNGAIANAISNVKLTYKKTGIAMGDWNPPAGTTLYWTAGMSYIAYYPYKEDVTIDATQNSDEIVASLAENQLLQPVTDQSTVSKYTACDLMTSIGELADDGNSSTKKILNLNFSHQFTLLVLKPQASFEYVSPGDTIFTYRDNIGRTVDVTAQQVILNDVTACKMDDGSYRAIVLPKSATRISGNYKVTDISTGMDKNITYSGHQTIFNAGYCYTLTVNSTLNPCKRERQLLPGDFVFFKDGKIEIKMHNKGVFNKIAQVLFKKPKYSYIELDEFGSFVWEQMDGKKTIYEIGTLVKERFGDKAEPLYERLSQYIKILHNNHFIVYENKLRKKES